LDDAAMILMFGVTGRIGRWLPAMLRDRGVRVRAVVRDPAAARELLGPGLAEADLFQGDATDPASWREALDGIERVYVGLSTGRTSDEVALLDAVATAGVPGVVKISGLGAAADCVIPMGLEHYKIERHMDALGLAGTSLRPSLMMHNLLGEAQNAIRAGRLPSTAGDHRIAWIHARDVAAVAAVALTESGHGGKAYDLTGPEALTYDDLAQRLSDALGHPVAYEPISDEEYGRELLAEGFDPWAAEHLVTMYRDAVRAGYFDVVTDAVPSLTGVPAATFDEWVQENIEVLAPRAAT
jgi:uncharacterized protein YbjT (DUF2867 family)